MCKNTIQCEICGKSFKALTAKHLKSHETTLSEYKNQFPNAPTQSPYTIEQHSKRAIRMNKVRKGIPRSRETIDKIKETKKNNPRSAWNKGIPLSEDQKTHLSEIRKTQYATGEIVHWNTGNATPDEVKHKISETLLSQHRTYSESSKAKRAQTLEKKYLEGWTHPSTSRKGQPLNLTEEARAKIREASYRSNENKRTQKEQRLAQLMTDNQLRLNETDDYLYVITCEQCGVQFSRTISVFAPYRYDLYDGQYCPTCYPRYSGLYSHEYFNLHPHIRNESGLLYIALGTNNTECFIKIGITRQDPSKRLLNESHAYHFEVLTHINMLIYDAFILEQHILTHLQKYKYQPLVDFGGKTECFSLDALDEIVESIDAFISTEV